MNATPPGRVYQALLAWPEPHNTALWRALRALTPLLKVTFANSSTLATHLGATDYYHMLHLSPLQWRAFGTAEQQRIAGHIPLIILGPEAALAEDLACARGGLYFPETQPLAAALDVVCEFHARLAEGRTLGEALAATQGLMALVGNARCLDMETPAAPEPASKATAVNAPGPAVIGVVGPNSGIAIGQIIVKGDAVSGNKTVQQAGGDQVNINRIGDSSGGIAQGAAGNQVPTSPKVERRQVCRACGWVAESGNYSFCQHCGAKLEDIG